MNIDRHIRVPTGDILVVDAEKGPLELLSLGDYGKEVNIKCDALGLTREPKRVHHQAIMPLEKKWVITISTQYGCSMGCFFCDVPKVGPGRNATFKDLIDQVNTGIALHPEVGYTERLNVHFARMGEPTWNPEVLEAALWMKRNLDPVFRVHPVVSTMMPRHNKNLKSFLTQWMEIKNEVYQGNAGLQLSINTTSNSQRREDFGDNSLRLDEIASCMNDVLEQTGIRGRKVTLNFAVADYFVDPQMLRELFDPDLYIVKLTPMHKTKTALDHYIETEGDYTTFAPYEQLEEGLKRVGFDVLVFIASEEEDLGRITCGNAILSGTLPECTYEEIR